MKATTRIIVPLLLSAAFAHAAFVATADFTGMSVTNQTTVGPLAGANGFTWTQLNPSGTDPNFSVANDDGSPGIGAGDALRMNTSSNWRGMIGTLPSTTTINIGETMVFSFTGRYDSTPAANAGGLRFGFINPDSGDNNFFAQLGTGGNTAFALFRDVPNDGSPGAGAGAVNLSAAGSGSTYTSLVGDTYSASLAITRTAASEYQVVADVNGAIRTATTLTGWDDYNGIFIRNGGINPPILIDNVAVSLIPEPATALLAAFGLLGLLKRRRQ